MLTAEKTPLVLRNCVAADARGGRDGPVDIVIVGERIAEIGQAGRLRVPAEAVVTDLDGATVVPGLVNMHEHLCGAHPGTLEQEAIAGETDIACVVRMIGNAQKGVHAGVTGMRLVGERDGLDIVVRNAIGRGLAGGPRLWTAGAPLDFKGGHGWVVGALEGSSPSEYAEAATSQVSQGVDLLKLMICESGSSPEVNAVRLSIEEFSAIRTVVREAGIRMALHTAAVDHPIMEMVLADGLDSLEHCYSISPEFVDRCVDRRLLLVMTPLVGRCREYFETIRLSEAMLAGLDAMSAGHWSAVCIAVSRGASLALGTDIHSHLCLDGTWAVVRELELYEEAGATPQGVLRLASRNAAEWLGLENDLGLVEEGYLADLVVLADNPLERGASAFRSMNQVIAGGVRVAVHPAEPPPGA